MVLTSTERQRRYRQRKIVEGSDVRLDLIVTAHAKAALERLAAHHKRTQRQILESVLVAAEAATLADLADSADYFALPGNDK